MTQMPSLFHSRRSLPRWAGPSADAVIAKWPAVMPERSHTQVNVTY